MMNASGLVHETYFGDYVEDELDRMCVRLSLCVCFSVTGGVLQRMMVIIAF